MNAMEHGGQFDPSQHVEVSYVRTRRMFVPGKGSRPGFSLEELEHSAIANPEEDPFKHMETREAQGKRGRVRHPDGHEAGGRSNLQREGNEVLLVKYLDKPAAASGS